MVTQASIKNEIGVKTPPRFDDLYTRLNEGQRLAVDTTEGPVMVMAGPGTGKTQVLAMRIANILKTTQMDPWNILCLTFTESGVVAMRERLLSIIGTPAYYVRIHTFHSFCNEIIQENPEFFAWTRGVQVISDIDRVLLLRSIVEKLSARSPLKPFGDPYLYFQDITTNIQDLKREDISPEMFVDIVGRLETFTGNVKEKVEDFFSIQASARTEGACHAIHVELVKAGNEYNLPESMVALVNHIFESYEEQIAVAENKRERGKANTAYKNALKKWFGKIVDTLPKQKEMANVYGVYQKEMADRGAYDYEDMIIKVVEELSRNDKLLAHYQEQFQYILVDEYQDTNGAQNDVVDLLGSFDERPNIFVVGDDKQSIYRFQGASLANMLHFYERYKEAITVISLRENYRSQQMVLDAAAGLISHNEETIARYVPGVTSELVSEAGREPERLTLRTFDSEDAEDYFIATRCRELIADGVAPSQIAVLYRYNRDGQSVLRLMQRLQIPVRLEVGENILEDHLVQQWIALLTWLTNGHSQEALAHILHYDWWHLPPVDVLKAIHYAGRAYKDLYTVIASAGELKKAGVEAVDQFVKFGALLAGWRKDATDLPLRYFLEKLVVESHWLDHVMEHEQQAAALRKVTALLNEAKNLNAAHRNFRVEDFVHHLTLLYDHGVQLPIEPWQSKQEAVRLMSAHKAKGLEFEYVFIMRMNDRHWGNVREANHIPLPEGLVKYDFVTADTNEDERRLFYVALTRARQHVSLSRAVHSGTGRKTVPSLFLGDLPTEVVSIDTTAETDVDSLARLKDSFLSPVQYAERHDVREYLTSLLENYTMSVTHLNNYLDCPRKFYFRNLLHLPTVKTKSLAMGSGVHAALYDLFEHINSEKRIPDKEFVLTRFERAIQSEFLLPADLADALEQGRHILEAYYDHYKDSFADHSLLEYSFAGHGIHVGDLKLTGTIDKVEILDKQLKTVNVVDYKTGNVERGLKKLQVHEDYWRQLVFYKLLCDESPRFGYRMVSGEVDFIEPSPKKGFIKKTIEVHSEDVEDLKKTIRTVWQQIKNLTFLDRESGCGEKDCEYCR